MSHLGNICIEVYKSVDVGLNCGVDLVALG